VNIHIYNIFVQIADLPSVPRGTHLRPLQSEEMRQSLSSQRRLSIGLKFVSMQPRPGSIALFIPWSPVTIRSSSARNRWQKRPRNGPKRRGADDRRHLSSCHSRRLFYLPSCELNQGFNHIWDETSRSVTMHHAWLRRRSPAARRVSPFSQEQRHEPRSHSLPGRCRPAPRL
jgi:hypothetical protein